MTIILQMLAFFVNGKDTAELLLLLISELNDLRLVLRVSQTSKKYIQRCLNLS